jgi:hypothetical protein
MAYAGPLAVPVVQVVVMGEVEVEVVVDFVVVWVVDVVDVMLVVVVVVVVVEDLEVEDVVLLEDELVEEVLLEDELVLDAVYVPLLNVSTYWLMVVASWSPGLENSPTANAISIVDPTPSLLKSYGEAFFRVKGR